MLLQDSDIEKLLVLHLDGQNRLNCIQIQTGTVNRAAAYVREIIKHALLSSSSGIGDSSQSSLGKTRAFRSRYPVYSEAERSLRLDGNNLA